MATTTEQKREAARIRAQQWRDGIKERKHCIDCGKQLNVYAASAGTLRCLPCANIAKIGWHWKDEAKIKLGLTRKGKFKGENAGNWRGGVSAERKINQGTDAYKQWRASVFEADDFTCCDCGKRGVTLHAHHIMPYAKYPLLRTNRHNGVTLCVPCHRKIHGKLGRGV